MLSESSSDGGDGNDSDELDDDGEWKRLWDLGLVLLSPLENVGLMRE